MKKDIKIGSVEHNAYMDLFAFHRDYGTPERDDKYWDDMLAAATKIDRKWRDTPQGGIVTNCMIALMDYLDKEARRKYGKN